MMMRPITDPKVKKDREEPHRGLKKGTNKKKNQGRGGWGGHWRLQ